MKRIYPKRYLYKIFLLISGGLLVLVLALSAVLFSNSEKVVLDERQRNDRIILSQIADSISFMHASILNVCTMLYNNPDVVALMTDRSIKPDIGNMTMEMYNINRTFVRTSPYIQSIYVYNPSTKTYYNSSSRGLLFRDTDLQAYIAGHKILPKLKPIYRSIKAPGIEVSSDTDLLTYFQYDSMSDGRMNGGIVINVRTGWLLDNLNTVSSAGGAVIGSVLLETDSGDFLNSQQFDREFLGALRKVQDAHTTQAGWNFYRARLMGVDYVISDIPVDGTGFHLLRVARLSQVDSSINALRLTIVLVTVGFVLLAVVVALLLSSRIYRPVGLLVNKIADRETGPVKDEFGFLGEVFEKNAAAIRQYESERHSYLYILKNAWLQGLLNGQQAVTREDFLRMAAEYQLSLTPDSGFFAAVLMVDAPFPEAAQERERLLFAVLTAASRALAESFPNEGVELPGGRIGLIINAGSSAAEGELLRLIGDAQGRIGQELELSVSVSVSAYGGEPGLLPSLYEQAQQNTVYRFLYGKKCVITAASVLSKPAAESMDYSFPAEKDFVDALKLGKLPDAKEILERILQRTRMLSYTGAMISLFHLTHTIRRTLGEIARADAGHHAAAIGAIGHDLLGQETIDAFREDLLARLEAFFTFDPVHGANRKHELVVDTIQRIVLHNYSDVDMDLTGLAGMMKMSSKQLSRIFRDNTGMSLPDYINAVRMQKAAELLESTDLSVSKIAARIGILNETYFFTMFKKHFGASPSAYKTSKALDRARQSSGN